MGWGLLIAFVIGTFTLLALTSPRRKGRRRLGLEALGVRIVPAGNTLHWIGPAGGNWNVAANWAENQIPVAGNGDTLVFDDVAGQAANTNSTDNIANLTIANLTVNAAFTQTITVSQDLEVDGNVFLQTGTTATLAVAQTQLLRVPLKASVFTWEGGTINGAVILGGPGQIPTLTLDAMNSQVTLNGNFDSYGNATLTTNKDIVMGAGAVFLTEQGATFNITNDQGFVAPNGGLPQFTNGGLFEKTAGTGTSKVQTLFSNSGTILAGSGTISFAQGVTQGNGATQLYGGAINLPFFNFNLQGGYLEGTGTITGAGSVVQTGGWLIPGDGANNGGAPGTLTISGSYTESGGTLVINTDSAGDVSLLNVSGNVDVKGAAVINKDPEFNPGLGSTFTFLTWGTITQQDDFSSVGINNNYPYGGGLYWGTTRLLTQNQYDIIVKQQ